jgi:hypothetical protein
MSTTTYSAVRASQFSAIEGIAPTSLASVLFIRHRAEQDFRVWAVENPQACFRRFDILDLFEYTAPIVTNNDQNFVEGREEITIAYPEDFRFGDENLRDMGDVILSDQFLIDKNIGLGGGGIYTDAHAVLESFDTEDADGVTFLNMTFVFRFYRSR